MLNEVLRKSKSRILLGRNIVYLILIGSIGSVNAQGITNTIGGNTANDKFIVENSDSDVGLVVTGAGRVGIGTASPWTIFEVNWNPPSNNINPLAIFESVGGTNSSAAIRVQNTSGNNYNFGITTPTANAFAIAYNTNIGLTSDLLRITSDGNVGIGTMSPGAKLDLAGNIKIVDGTEGAGKVLTSDASGLASWQTSIAGTDYSVGDFVQGGIVFWVDESGKHGLVCAKEDQSSEYWSWIGGTTDLGVHGDGPFAGEMNTMIIIANQGGEVSGDPNNYAARICADLMITENSYTYGDWYLPSKEELNMMYLTKIIIDAIATVNGGSAFTTNEYWSSTENSTYSAFSQSFSSGTQYTKSKINYELYVRAVRAF